MSLKRCPNSQDKCKVVSKYFTSSVGMDDSLSDFQEKKKTVSGPKKPEKASNKAKKPIKRIKGQKDIRSVIKGKQNDLVTYSKDFDNICKKSGIDVDSEQLQIAIALSKSVQTGPDDNYSTQSTSSSSQERAKKIRLTLQEYGFVVPEIKKDLSKKRSRKHTKQYKLLLTNATEQEQLISSRYSQILFENFNNQEKHSDFDNSQNLLYHVASNISYKEIKDDSVFYVQGIVEKSDSKLGCLLKDWSEIPGRPKSPLPKQEKVNISEIVWTPEEFDIILSGPLKKLREMVKNKSSVNEIFVTCGELVGNENNCNNIEEMNTIVIMSSSEAHVPESSTVNTQTESKEILRSTSPDLFDDETSLVFENTKDNVCNNPPIQKTFIEYMDLTECVINPVVSVAGFQITNSQLSQGNVTKRRSNDLMEITECVATVKNSNIEVQIDLTQDVSITKDIDCKEIEKSVDLTQSSDSNDLPFVQISGTVEKNLEETIIMDDEDFKLNNDVIDLENIQIDNVENVVEVSNDYSFKDTSIKEVNLNKSNSSDNVRISNEDIVEDFDYNHSDHANDIVVSQSTRNSTHKEDDCIDIDRPKHDLENEGKEIDLTQTSDSENSQILNEEINIQKISFESLGKRDNISIDYDEIICCNETYDKDIANNSPLQTINYSSSTEKASDKQNSAASSSNHSCVFEISDGEFNYSMNKSKLDLKNNFDLGGLSVMDDLSNVNNLTNNSSVKKSILPESELPEVTMGTKEKTGNRLIPGNVLASFSQNISSPLKENNTITFETPKNSVYVLKTNDVTPMLDYASMSTPERNLQLDKYGLKPFKRKRAIQLLTHLYNQTHPVVEKCPEEAASLSKKLKQSQDSVQNEVSPKKLTKSPRKLAKSPRKTIKSPAKVTENIAGGISSDDMDNIYVMTNELPELKEIDCLPDDWVFKKREKVKVHSCRVPLHIAFSNYVLSRRRLHEAILRYEPINIDVIHKDLVAIGHRYDPKELLKFLDKKCITVKTADNNARNNK